MIVVTGAKTQGVRGRWATRPVAIKRLLQAKKTDRHLRIKVAGKEIEYPVRKYAGKIVSVSGEQVKVTA